MDVKDHFVLNIGNIDDITKVFALSIEQEVEMGMSFSQVF